MIPLVMGERNPAAVYCEELGYAYEITVTDSGQQGLCLLPDGSRVDAWEFLKGMVGQDYSYCGKQGLETRMVTDQEICASIVSSECAVCGEDQTEVTAAMNLDFSEGICGDGVCTIDETHLGCPEDCPEEEPDEEICVYDGYCSEECEGKDDPDCLCSDHTSPECKDYLESIGQKEDGNKKIISIVLLSIGLVALLGVIYFKRK